MSKYEEFLQRVADTSPFLPGVLTEHELAELGTAFVNRLAGTPGPKRLASYNNPEQRWWATRLLVPTGAISASLDHLLDLQVIIRRFAFAGTRVTPARYLRLMLNAYFQEVFVLRDRILALFNSLAKDYGDTEIGEKLTAFNPPLCQALKEALKRITTARTAHVHKLGFDAEGLCTLDVLDLVSSTGVGEVEAHAALQAAAGAEYKSSFRKERSFWAREILKCNEGILQAMDPHFAVLLRLLFSSEGALHYPSAIAAQHALAADAAPRRR